MLRAVLDANVFVSAALRPEGPPGQIIERFLHDAAFEVVFSPPIVEEVLRALIYPKVQRLIHGATEPDLWFEDFIILADLVSGEFNLPGICQDPDDDKYIAAALEGRCAFLVTGDKELLTLQAHEGVRIVTPRDLLRLLEL